MTAPASETKKLPSVEGRSCRGETRRGAGGGVSFVSAGKSFRGRTVRECDCPGVSARLIRAYVRTYDSHTWRVLRESRRPGAMLFTRISATSPAITKSVWRRPLAIESARNGAHVRVLCETATDPAASLVPPARPFNRVKKKAPGLRVVRVQSVPPPSFNPFFVSLSSSSSSSLSSLSSSSTSSTFSSSFGPTRRDARRRVAPSLVRPRVDGGGRNRERNKRKAAGGNISTNPRAHTGRSFRENFNSLTVYFVETWEARWRKRLYVARNSRPDRTGAP